MFDCGLRNGDCGMRGQSLQLRAYGLRLILASVCLLSLMACRPTPRALAPLVLPTAAPLMATPTPSPSPSITPLFTLTPSLTPSATPPFTPSPLAVGAAVRPNDIPLLTSTPQPFNLNPTLVPILVGTTELRPPPLPVPLAIHPDDHYWLARPLPSGSRNYALEWYPYGNDVLLAEIGAYRIHHGLDFPNPNGTQILAAGSGRVIWAGELISDRDGVSYYGNTIVIQHDWQWQEKAVYTLYAHAIELFVSVGDVVEQGQLLAGVGGTGYTSGSHLHFEVRVGEDEYFAVRNPYLWLAPYEGWGTLAGRFVDVRGEPISGAELVVTPLQVSADIAPRRQKTYEDLRLIPDEVWNENFVVGDLPAGQYQLDMWAAGEDGILRQYTNLVEIRPGRTNFVLVQADFVFIPTPTPVPVDTAEPTLEAEAEE
ncbi:MAG: peptidoglycan DD-metalloendopeptidase family protein [Chloroflexi bacterium]|nr:peptidoglycan DD-metalloendopeptidase family protein [Chloroflexota bacterium]